MHCYRALSFLVLNEDSEADRTCSGNEFQALTFEILSINSTVLFRPITNPQRMTMTVHYTEIAIKTVTRRHRE